MEKNYFIAIVPENEETFQESAKHGGGTIDCSGEREAIYCRIHNGDENGNTTYKWGEIVLVDAESRKIISAYKGNEITSDFKLSLTDKTSTEFEKESRSDWIAASDYVMTGRIHKGDENGKSTIISKKINIQYKDTSLDFNIIKNEHQTVKESSGEIVQYPIENCIDPNGNEITLYLPIIGRTHEGDENGDTTTMFAMYSSDVPEYMPRYCMIGRCHSGDENGTTQVKFAAITLPQRAKDLGYDEVWLANASFLSQKESASDFILKTKPAQVITRRFHNGDENKDTGYYFAEVWAKKDGRAAPLSCAIDIVDVYTEKESNGCWVEKEGYVIIGRKHNGDENAPTITRFAKLYLMAPKVKDGKIEEGFEAIPLELTDTQILEQKESKSDFYIDKVSFANQFKVHYSPAFSEKFKKVMDHVWVESVNPKGVFCCNGSTEGDDIVQIANVDGDAYSIMDQCRGKNDFTNMTYALDGVCHQAANRFIYPVSGTLIIKGDHPKAYGLSCFFYGKLGRRYSDWFNNTVVPAMRNINDQKSVVKKSQIKYLQESVQELLSEYSINFDYTKLKHIQQFWLDNSNKIASKYGITNSKQKNSFSEDCIRNFISELIDLQRTSLLVLKNTIGEQLFNILNDGQSEIPDIIDVQTAIDFFCKKKR